MTRRQLWRARRMPTFRWPCNTNNRQHHTRLCLSNGSTFGKHSHLIPAWGSVATVAWGSDWANEAAECYLLPRIVWNNTHHWTGEKAIAWTSKTFECWTLQQNPFRAIFIAFSTKTTIFVSVECMQNSSTRRSTRYHVTKRRPHRLAKARLTPWHLRHYHSTLLI